MPQCSLRRPDHRGNSQSFARKLASLPKIQVTRSNQVPFIPASRGIITRPAFFLAPSPPPLFFFHPPPQESAPNNRTVQRSGCSRPALCRTWPSTLPIKALTFIPSLFLCCLAMNPGPDRERGLLAGDRRFTSPTCWGQRHKGIDTGPLCSVCVLPPHSLVTAIATRSKEEERNAEPVRNWLH
ncbi:hypothetical protein BC827DRAFT_14 [Russula dissimulans]|nr:hypothetical protein BC827DRAFT_14 [Russula dissimulans]